MESSTVSVMPEASANRPKPVATLKGHGQAIVALAFSPDRARLATADSEGGGRLWEIGAVIRERARFGDENGQLHALAFSPDGRSLIAATGFQGGGVRLIDVSEKAPRDVAVLRGARGGVDCVAVSPDGKLIAGGGEDHVLRVWDFGKPELRNQLPGHTGPIRALTFSPDSQGAATAGADAAVRLWTLGRIRSSQRGVLSHPAEVVRLGWSPDGKVLATACRDGVIRLWDPTSFRPSPLAQIGKHTDNLRLMAFTSDKGILITINGAMKVVNWDPTTGRAVREWDLPADPVSSTALTPDGRYLAAGKSDGAVDIYRVADKRM